MTLRETLDQDTNFNAMVRQRGIINLFHADAQRDAYRRHAGRVSACSRKGRAWVDFQNDVTVKDLRLAHWENMRPVEPPKRWTTLGMATDQGKTANVTALAVMAELTDRSIPDTGTTMFRPRHARVLLGVPGGGDTGPAFRPPHRPRDPCACQSQGAPDRQHDGVCPASPDSTPPENRV